MAKPPPRLHRLGETGRDAISILVNGIAVSALVGDTVMVAVLSNGRSLKQAEFGGGNRAGFCLMGACQDCWMWTAAGDRLRACTTPVASGMDLITTIPQEHVWPVRA